MQAVQEAASEDAVNAVEVIRRGAAGKVSVLVAWPNIIDKRQIRNQRGVVHHLLRHQSRRVVIRHTCLLRQSVRQIVDGHRILLPGDSGSWIFVVFGRRVHISFHQQPARQSAHVPDLQRDLAGQLARVSGVEHDGIRGLQVGRNAQERAGDGGDGGRSIGESTGGRGRKGRIRARKSRRCGEAVGVREVGRVGKSQRPVLIVIHDQVVAELVVGDAAAEAEGSRFPKNLAEQPGMIHWGVGKPELRREVGVVRSPPGRLPVHRAVQRVA